MPPENNVPERLYCERCRKAMLRKEFYQSNNTEKYPNGFMPLCKKCLCAHVDVADPDTFTPVLQELDVPYVPKEWQASIARQHQNGRSLTPVSIMGRYLSKMKLNQWKEYRWKDNDFIKEQEELKVRQAMKQHGYSNDEVMRALTTGIEGVPMQDFAAAIAQIIQEQTAAAQPTVEPEPAPAQIEDYFGQDLPDEFIPNLSEEDKTYLILKWGKSYRPEEWVRLEQLYEEMTQSYDIQSAGHIDTLKLVCKTSLKANQLLDIGDVDGAQKMLRMYDSLMKSGKFTALQNKEEQGEYVNSLSELVLLCERDGFIPRFYVDQPQDKVDRVIQDMQDYTRNLVTEEMHLGALIERAVKEIEIDKLRDAESELDEASEEDEFEDALFDNTEEETEINYDDYVNFEEEEEKKEEADQELYESLDGEW